MIRIPGLLITKIKEFTNLPINRGTWKDIPFSKAKHFLGTKRIFSDRSRYVLSETAPNWLFTPVATPPAFSLFQFNRESQQLRILVGGEIIGQVNVKNP